jgi:AcrR family transcriptional regulator
MPNTQRVGSPSETRGRGRRAGVRSNEAGQETRDRLLDVAERLLAERGLDAVSVRDITEAAGANTAAVHYHFGSKLDLMGAILERRADRVGRRRQELLDRLEQRPEIELRDVVEALVLPTAELVAEGGGGQHYVALVAALGDHPELVQLVIGAYDAYTERYLQTLSRVTTDLPDEVRMLRFAVGKDLINRLLGQPSGQVHLWVERQSPGADADMVTSLIDMLVGLFRAPVTMSRSVGGGERIRG